MSTHRRTGNFRRAPQRRKLVWSTFASSPTIPSSGNYGADLIADLEVAGASKLGCTVMRTHLLIQVTWGAVVQPGFDWMGLKCADQNEISTPLNVPGNPDLDWALLTWLPSFATGATTNATTYERFDLKAKRRIEELGQTWGLFIFNPTTVSQTLSIHARTLLALP